MDGSQTEISFRISILGCRVADAKPRVFMFEPRTMIKASLVTACLCQIAHYGGELVAAMFFTFVRSFTIAQRNRVSRCTFVRSALQCSGASHPALRVPACGELLCFRQQLLRLPNGFRFLGVRACRDLSSFTCVWHIFVLAHFRRARRSVLHRRSPSPVQIPWCRRTSVTQGGINAPLGFVAIPTVPKSRSAF